MSAYTEANRKAVNDLSASYDSKPWQHALANQVAEALQQRKDWIGAQWIDAEENPERRDVRLLDYACGTGAITRALGPYVKTIRGIDISENMVSKYNEAARSSGLSEEQAHAVVGDLCAQEATQDPQFKGQDWYEFDIAVIGLGFHHFEYPNVAMKRLAERLKAGTGILVIVDFLPFDEKHNHDHGGNEGESPGMQHTIKHNGFKPETLRDMYVEAGFEDFDIVALKQPAVLELKTGTVQRTLFVAKGRKSETWWQKFSGWVGGLQDVAGGQFKIDKKDAQQWEPGFAKGGEVWNTSKQKDETWNAVPEEQNGPKKPWNMGF
ncbi:hypothetical protein AC578_4182 [Pseudocercospora eumusae]|uniref:Methyltransferase domain-containing protein n=1 Tax=Pseudocercospora eumusae TaxID=321146 RepID=A0A139HJ16_9PEZI|nr:hypothetical protein AC578_4182 [Pseudocercospora eumusae]